MNTRLCKAIRTYGFENFIIEVIEIVEDVETLNLREMHWIQALKPEYNMTEGGDGGDTSYSPNYRLGILRRKRNQLLSNWRPWNFGKFGAENPCFGRKLSPGQRESLKNGITKSWASADQRREDQRNRMFGFNAGAKRNAKAVVFENREFPSLAAASRATGRSLDYIRKNCTPI